MRSALQAARNAEYEKIVEQREDLRVRLRNWPAKVWGHDVLGAEGRQAAEKVLDACGHSPRPRGPGDHRGSAESVTVG